MADGEGEASRRKLLGRIAGGVALGLAGTLGGRLLFAGAALPPLIRNLPDEPVARDRAFAAAGAKRFPVGTAEAQLRQQLASEGFAVHSDDRRADWRRSHGDCHEFAQVEWSAADGRIIGTRAVLWSACR
jgi:hypothetical protein